MTKREKDFCRGGEVIRQRTRAKEYGVDDETRFSFVKTNGHLREPAVGYGEKGCEKKFKEKNRSMGGRRCKKGKTRWLTENTETDISCNAKNSKGEPVMWVPLPPKDSVPPD